MAKKQPEPPSPSRPRGRPKSEAPKGRSPIALTIRANGEWQKWFEGFCDALRRDAGLSIKLDRTDAIDIALAKTAKALGFPEPPSRY
jgi:hypothetical protein